jgi:hypothetical protein
MAVKTGDPLNAAIRTSSWSSELIRSLGISANSRFNVYVLEHGYRWRKLKFQADAKGVKLRGQDRTLFLTWKT